MISEYNTRDSSDMSSFNYSGETGGSYIKNYVRDLLKSRIFLGRYLERRLVNREVGYRAVILLSSAEIELQRDLLEVKQKLQTVTKVWIGITDSEFLSYSPAGVCIWSDIVDQPFGPFWFQIKNITFRDIEIFVKVKCIRHISEAFLELEPLLTSGKVAMDNKSVKTEDIKAAVAESCTEVVDTLKTSFTFTNVKGFLTFIFAFIIAVCTGTIELINFLGNFILALVRESSIFVNNATPMFLGILDFFSKIVGGFYILLAMIFNQNHPASVPSTNMRRIEHYQHRNEDYNRNFD